jgi:hypothetical protein
MKIKTAAILSGVALTALALSGCVRVVADTSIGAHDTFSQHVIIAFNDSVATQVGQQAGIDVEDLTDSLASSPEFSALQTKYPDQVVIDDYTDEDLNGVELTMSDLPLSEFNDTASQATAVIGSSASIEHTDGAYVVTMNAATADPAAQTEGATAAPDPDALLGGAGLGDLESLGLSDANLSMIESAIEFEVSYTFPGLVTEASVGDIDGTTVTLGISDLTSGTDIRIVGGDSPQIDWWPFIKWALIIAAFASVISAAGLLVRQDQRRQRTNNLPAPVAPDSAPNADPEDTVEAGASQP